MRGSKAKYTAKQKRQAKHIAEGYKKKGTSTKTAKKRAWATVNKLSGGGLKGRKKSTSTSTKSKTKPKSRKSVSTIKRKSTPWKKTSARRTPRRSTSSKKG